MKTDKQLYKILQAVPALFTDLTGIPLPTDYVFQAVTLKEVQRDLDGVLSPRQVGLGAPVYVIEFQAYYDSLIYARLLWETFGYQLKVAEKNQPVEAVLFFLDVRFDPKQAPWHELGRSGQAGLRVFYLDEVIAGLPQTHILNALFLPVLEADVQQIRNQAPTAYAQLRAMPGLDAAQKDNLLAVFESWLIQRFTELSAKELRTMLNLPTTPLEETRFYREVIQEGIKRGIKEGIKEGVKEGIKKGRVEGITEGRVEGSVAEGRKFLRRQLRKRFGELPQWAEQKLLDADVETLELWGEALLDAESLEAVFQ